MDKLNIDLFAKEVTYLPFDAVISLCQSDKKLHEYCTNPRYNNVWKSLIDNTFGKIENYQDKLKPLLEKYGGYNYLVYVNLVKTLDKVSQAMIYYRQGDMTNFNKIHKAERFLALFLLDKKDEMKKLLPQVPGFKIFIDFLEGKYSNASTLLSDMAGNGSIAGVKYFLSKGANINGSQYHNSVESAVFNDNLDMVKFLIKNGATVLQKHWN